MTLKQKRKLKRENTPKYYKIFNLTTLLILLVLMVCFFAYIFFLALSDDSEAAADTMVISLFIFLAVLIVYLIVVLVVAVKVRNRLINERISEIESEFSDMPFAEAETALTDKKIITEQGFTSNVGGSEEVVPFEGAQVAIHSANIYNKIVTVALISNPAGEVKAKYVLDKLLYNYLLKKGVKVYFYGYSNLIVSEKTQFVNKYFKGDDNKMAMTFLLGLLGALVSDKSSGINASKKTVLNVLSKEI